MVGSNLFADGIWPITSNDGHLSVVKFRRDDRQRFWFVDPAQTDALSLAGVFAAWAKTLVTGLRLDVAQLGACLQVRRTPPARARARKRRTHARDVPSLALSCPRPNETRADATAAFALSFPSPPSHQPGGDLDEVSCGVQRHLESGILCLILAKIVSAGMEVEAERSSNLLGDQLLAEEEALAARARAKERER